MTVINPGGIINISGSVVKISGETVVTRFSGETIITVGNVANDGIDAGNPIKIGGHARTTNPTAVADGDRVDAIFDKLGRQIVVMNHARGLIAQNTVTITNSSAETTIFSAVAEVFLDLTSLDITNRSAKAVTVTIKDATAGTTRAIYSLAANGGIAKTWIVPFKQAVVNNNWTATLSANDVIVDFVAQAAQNL